jgi:hypothetical protein
MIAEQRANLSRAMLGLIAIGGTILYAASFTICDAARTLAPLASAVGASAGLAWIGFGFIILLIDGRRRVSSWVDLCLQTQALGIAVLMLAAGANATFFASVKHAGALPLFPAFIAFHLGLLLLSDALMALAFVRGAVALRFPARHALAAWILGLNGIFAIVLAMLLTMGVFT